MCGADDGPFGAHFLDAAQQELAEPDRENSIRWVIAQWKEQPLSDVYDDSEDSPRPFLALRFDDGVLHVTFQQEHCRCLIASARHPTREIPWWEPDGRGGSTPVPTKDISRICESTLARAKPGDRCEPEREFEIEYGDSPVLSSPLGAWTEMTFRIKGGPTGYLEVDQDGRPIAKVTGKVGYQHSDPESKRGPTKTKFKTGHYRDFMPFEHWIDIDRLQAGMGPVIASVPASVLAHSLSMPRLPRPNTSAHLLLWSMTGAVKE